jgi:hypothetical protein
MQARCQVLCVDVLWGVSSVMGRDDRMGDTAIPSSGSHLPLLLLTVRLPGQGRVTSPRPQSCAVKVPCRGLGSNTPAVNLSVIRKSRVKGNASGRRGWNTSGVYGLCPELIRGHWTAGGPLHTTERRVGWCVVQVRPTLNSS